MNGCGGSGCWGQNATGRAAGGGRRGRPGLRPGIRMGKRGESKASVGIRNVECPGGFAPADGSALHAPPMSGI